MPNVYSPQKWYCLLTVAAVYSLVFLLWLVSLVSGSRHNCDLLYFWAVRSEDNTVRQSYTQIHCSPSGTKVAALHSIKHSPSSNYARCEGREFRQARWRLCKVSTSSVLTLKSWWCLHFKWLFFMLTRLSDCGSVSAQPIFKSQYGTLRPPPPRGCQ